MEPELCLQICLIIHVFAMILAKEKVSLAALKSELMIGIFHALRGVTEARGPQVTWVTRVSVHQDPSSSLRSGSVTCVPCSEPQRSGWLW